ncbi:hypothetical protein, partial [Gulosibacter faecalis]|uniref:hypothetical protein n=1 Tax=Gulosibacter faecalis TaxID=272240 RepID=UPI001F1F61DB
MVDEDASLCERGFVGAFEVFAREFRGELFRERLGLRHGVGLRVPEDFLAVPVVVALRDGCVLAEYRVDVPDLHRSFGERV